MLLSLLFIIYFLVSYTKQKSFSVNSLSINSTLSKNRIRKYLFQTTIGNIQR